MSEKGKPIIADAKLFILHQPASTSMTESMEKVEPSSMKPTNSSLGPDV